MSKQNCTRDRTLHSVRRPLELPIVFRIEEPPMAGDVSISYSLQTSPATVLTPAGNPADGALIAFTRVWCRAHYGTACVRRSGALKRW